jgi:hypothetical protein
MSVPPIYGSVLVGFPPVLYSVSAAPYVPVTKIFPDVSAAIEVTSSTAVLTIRVAHDTTPVDVYLTMKASDDVANVATAVVPPALQNDSAPLEPPPAITFPEESEAILNMDALV